MDKCKIQDNKLDDELRQELYKLIAEKGQPTGSRFYGGYTENSDYDFVLSEGNISLGLYKRLITLINNGSNVNNSQDAFISIYIAKQDQADQYYNLIILTERDYNIWLKVNNKMLELNEILKEQINYKPFRVNLFELLFNFYKNVKRTR